MNKCTKKQPFLWAGTASYCSRLQIISSSGRETAHTMAPLWFPHCFLWFWSSMPQWQKCWKLWGLWGWIADKDSSEALHSLSADVMKYLRDEMAQGRKYNGRGRCFMNDKTDLQVDVKARKMLRVTRRCRGWCKWSKSWIGYSLLAPLAVQLLCICFSLSLSFVCKNKTR